MKRVLLLATLLPLVVSCKQSSGTLTQVQQQRSGDYVVALYSDSGAVKQRSNKLTIEILNAPNNESATVNNVKAQATMRMPGASPMFADVTAPKEIGKGRYEIDADFSMAGQWALVLTFDPNGRVQFNVNAQ